MSEKPEIDFIDGPPPNELVIEDIIEGEIVLLHVALEQSLLDHPVDFGLNTTEVLRLHGLQSALP